MEAAVRKIRSSRAARANTSESIAPGAANPIQNDIVPCRLESGDSRAGEILVGQEAHLRLCSGIPSPRSAHRGHMRNRR